MVHALSNGLRPVRFLFPRQEEGERAPSPKERCCSKIILLFAAVLLSPLIFAQGNPQVTAVDPTTGKVNDSVTIAGANLGKGNVVAVFLSDDKERLQGDHCGSKRGQDRHEGSAGEGRCLQYFGSGRATIF